MGDVSKAIADMEMMRKTHVDWAEHFERHPEVEAQYVATGEWDDAKEHRRLVSMYDNVISCLKATATADNTVHGGEPKLQDCNCWCKPPSVPVFRDVMDHLVGCPLKGSGKRVGTITIQSFQPVTIVGMP